MAVTLTGQYKHSIDAKGRLFVPAKLREELGGVFYIATGPDAVLTVYSEAGWAELEERIRSMPVMQSRELRRILYSSAMKGETDAQGRVLLSPTLRSYAGLDKSATIVGVGDHAEIWESQRWETECGRYNSETLESAMMELGM